MGGSRFILSMVRPTIMCIRMPLLPETRSLQLAQPSPEGLLRLRGGGEADILAASMLLVMLLGYGAQFRMGPSYLLAAARHPGKLATGQHFRLLTMLLVHPDPIQVAATWLAGVDRLVRPAATIFGAIPCVLISIAAGVGGNFASHRLGWLPGNVAVLGPSAAILGLDGALLAYRLRNHPGDMLSLSTALRRGALTMLATRAAAVASSRIQPVHDLDSMHLHSSGDDLSAQAVGYVVGAAMGYLLAPCLRQADVNFRMAVVSDMSDQISESTGTTSVAAEMAICRYLRRLPIDRRRAELRLWKLGKRPEDPTQPYVPRTEDWDDVFVRLKEFVAERIQKLPPPPESASPPAGDEAAVASAETRVERRTRVLRAKAEAAVWEHFAHRAAVAMPSLRLLRYADMGRVSLQQMRRWRVNLGSLVPLRLGEAIGGLALVALASSVREMMLMCAST